MKRHLLGFGLALFTLGLTWLCFTFSQNGLLIYLLAGAPVVLALAFWLDEKARAENQALRPAMRTIELKQRDQSRNTEQL